MHISPPSHLVRTPLVQNKFLACLLTSSGVNELPSTGWRGGQERELHVVPGNQNLEDSWLGKTDWRGATPTPVNTYTQGESGAICLEQKITPSLASLSFFLHSNTAAHPSPDSAFFQVS